MAFIIAEVSSNWHSLADCVNSVVAAKEAGANAVKFQLFTQKDLYGFSDEPKPSELNPEWVPMLAEKADSCGIEFMCTAFSPDALGFVDPYVKRHKIASSELTYPELLIAARRYERPIILSTGGATVGDIAQALKLLEYSKVSLLHCVAKYPAKNVNLYRLNALREFGKEVGYSCHTNDYMTAVMAAKTFGASIIEKHFRLPHIVDTPDVAHSIKPDEFKLMVRLMSHEADGYMEPQLEAATLYRRRLIALKDLAPGDRLILGDNYGVYRPKEPDCEGLSGFATNRVDGLVVAANIKKGQPIGPRAIEF